MTEPDPVALAVEAALAPSLAEAAAEVAAWVQAMAGRAVNGWDFTSIGPAPHFPRLRLRSLRVLAEHAYASGEPCDGERCEDGGAAHCHKCAEVEADEMLAERDQLRADLAKARADSESWQRIAAARESATPAETPDFLAYAWGESVTWTTGRILVPLNAGDQTTADMELDEAGALLLADMLKDAAAREVGM